MLTYWSFWFLCNKHYTEILTIEPPHCDLFSLIVQTQYYLVYLKYLEVFKPTRIRMLILVRSGNADICDGWSWWGCALVIVFPASPAGSAFCSNTSWCFVESQDQNVRPTLVCPFKCMLAVGHSDPPDPGPPLSRRSFTQLHSSSLQSAQSGLTAV